MKITITNIRPLKGKLPSSFSKAVKWLKRPYIPINESTYKDIIKNTKGDFLLLGDKENCLVCTFGNTGNEFALMPLADKYAQKVLKQNKLL